MEKEEIITSTLVSASVSGSVADCSAKTEEGNLPQGFDCLSSPQPAQLVDNYVDIRFTADIFDAFYIPNEPQNTAPPHVTAPIPPASILPSQGKRLPDSRQIQDMVEAGESAKTKKARTMRSKDKDNDNTSGESSSITIANVLRNLPKITVVKARKPIPKRGVNGNLVFPDFPEFQPNLTPKEILQRGSFGGTYFRAIFSNITGKRYEDAWREFPTDWFEGLSIEVHIASSSYRDEVNYYKVFCGSELKLWEESGWITEIDPYGWFQWYCRFYLGRRCSDDHRQISRALGVMGPNGRWKKNLVNKCLTGGPATEEMCNDHSIAPKIRQLLQHWGYKLTLTDLVQSVPQKKK